MFAKQLQKNCRTVTPMLKAVVAVMVMEKVPVEMVAARIKVPATTMVVRVAAVAVVDHQPGSKLSASFHAGNFSLKFLNFSRSRTELIIPGFSSNLWISFPTGSIRHVPPMETVPVPSLPTRLVPMR